jgi:hypothetical protein
MLNLTDKGRLAGPSSCDAGERVDTRTIKDPIFGFVFDVKGLIANLSLEGAKFTRLNQ